MRFPPQQDRFQLADYNEGGFACAECQNLWWSGSSCVSAFRVNSDTLWRAEVKSNVLWSVGVVIYNIVGGFAVVIKYADNSTEISRRNGSSVVWSLGNAGLSLCGSTDSQNINAKQAIINEFDWAEEAGYTLDAPDFKAYYLANADATIYDIDGNVLAEEKF